MSVAFPRPRETAPPPPLDGAVLVRCRAQDPMAFRAFVVRYERMVFALLSRMLVSGDRVALLLGRLLRTIETAPGTRPEMKGDTS